MEYFFETREEASIAAANRIVPTLMKRLDGQQAASLVVSGGTTPARCLAELSHAEIDWQRVHVLLSDERWVPPNDDLSNEKLVKETLLVNGASRAQLQPVYASDTDIQVRCEELDLAIRSLPFPFSCSLVGMGVDGHFASLFPDAGNLDEGLDVDSGTLCIPVQTDASPVPRISLTLAALSRSDEIILLFFGDEKREVYEKAKKASNGYPVSHLLLQKRAPVSVYWAP